MEDPDQVRKAYPAVKGRPAIHHTRSVTKRKNVSANEIDSDSDENTYDSGPDNAPHSRSQSPNTITQQKINTSNISNKSSHEYAEQHSSLSISSSSTSFTSKRTDTTQPPELKQPGNNWQYLAAAGFIVLALSILYLIPSKDIGPPPRFDCPQFKELTKRFSGQDTILWKSLKIGIEGVLNNKPTTPSIFLLAYHDTDTARRVMEEVVAATAACMNSSNPIQLDGRTFVTAEMLTDYGIIIEQYRDRLKHDGIMYVSDLNQMPAEAAQVFHTICDTITPLVGRAVIYFTVYVDEGDKNLSTRRVSELVETELETNWNRNRKVSADTLKALIGRVTDQVFLLKSEN